MLHYRVIHSYHYATPTIEIIDPTATAQTALEVAGPSGTGCPYGWTKGFGENQRSGGGACPIEIFSLYDPRPRRGTSCWDPNGTVGAPDHYRADESFPSRSVTMAHYAPPRHRRLPDASHHPPTTVYTTLAASKALKVGLTPTPKSPRRWRTLGTREDTPTITN